MRNLVILLSSFLGFLCADQYSEFLALCPYSHESQDDPIVFPDQSNKSHTHDFLGNTIADAYTTNVTQLLSGNTTCQPTEDLSSYWHPALMHSSNGSAIHAIGVRIYYETVNIPNLNTVQSMPNGLKMITGNSTADYPQPISVVQWDCVGESTNSQYILECAGNNLEAIITFPECWDGVNLDSPNHMSHMAYAPNANGCPPSHPVALPRLQLKIQFGIGFALSSDLMQSIKTGKNIPGNTLHADAFLAWKGNSMLTRVLNCNRAGIKCGTNGLPD